MSDDIDNDVDLDDEDEERDWWEDLSDSERLRSLDEAMGNTGVNFIGALDMLQEHEHITVYNIVLLAFKNLGLAQEHLRLALDLLGCPVQNRTDDNDR